MGDRGELLTDRFVRTNEELIGVAEGCSEAESVCSLKGRLRV